MIQVVRAIDALPDGFENLRSEARRDGWTHMDRLADEWAQVPRPLEAVLTVYVDGEFAGIGAVTREPAEDGVLRMRHFYVREAFRRRGVGRVLGSALMQEGLGRSASLTVHATRPAARSFWESLGFRQDERSGWSHRFGP
jgi:GNAT superfamily N-acetyltransferase